MKNQPGDLILDHLIPNATPEEREDGRRHLYDFVEALIEIGTRLEKESTSEFES
jgi:hypothetical protein